MHATRRLVQVAFLALTVAAVFILRRNAEAWCPFGGVEALYTYVREGDLLCSLAVSNFYILGAVLLLAVLFRRAFCGYMCPLGAIGERLQAGVRRIGLRPVHVPHALDRGLALLKYGVLAVILYFTWRTGELVFRGYDPCYALLSRHGEDITLWAYIISGGLVLLSLFVLVPFCRWLCPLAAVFHPFSRFGLTRIRRDGGTCINCGACARACMMGIRVDELAEVRAARCTSCLECVAACPPKVGALSWGPAGRRVRRWPQGVLIGGMLALVGAAVAGAYVFPLPSFAHERGERPAEVATLELGIHELTCRGRASLLTYFLDRDDEFAIPGYLRLEAWPGPGAAQVRVLYEARRATPAMIKAAITEPVFDPAIRAFRMPPFRIEGYDPLGL